MAPRYLNLVTSRGKTYHYFRPPKEIAHLFPQPIKLSPDPAIASLEVKALLERKVVPAHQALRPQRKSKPFAYHQHIVRMQKGAKNRAAQRGIEYALSEQDIYSLFLTQDAACAISGIRFALPTEKSDNFWKHPYYPSLDRINNSRGYTADNVRIVCTCVNIAINEWGDEIFFDLVRKTAQRLS